MIWQIIVLSLLAINLAFLDFKFFNLKTPVVQQISNVIPSPVDQCGPACQKYIDNRIHQIPSITPQPTSTKSLVTKQKSFDKIRQISYLPIPGNGQTGNNDWTSLTGTDFYFDAADYPGLISIYFESNINLFNGNGTAFVRLYDATNGVGVQGSDANTNNQSSTAVASGQVSFYRGRNLIKVQAKSLTADTAIYSSGRLKIITEN